MLQSYDITTNPQTILIVDDQPDNLELLGYLLSAQGYEVQPAANGSTALALAQAKLPDLILLDIMMPDLDGFAVAEALKADARTRDIPIIFISSMTKVFDKVRAFALGSVDYITKPFQVEEVLARINTHLTLRRLQRRVEAQNELLEMQVQERTAHLLDEMTRRQRHQQERDHLFDIVRQQSEQLQAMTRRLLESQQSRDSNLAQTLREQVDQKLHLLEMNLIRSRTLLSSPDDPATHYLEVSIQLRDLKANLQAVHAELNHPPPDTSLLRLTQREREILQLMAEGKSTLDIAQLLYLTESTIYTHRRRMMTKLGLDRAPDLLNFALQITQTPPRRH
jgi:DNA-binding response OmpR family regulator/DNA-binding CsgD family transcriptional regulator